MLASVVLCLVFIPTGGAEEWRVKNQTSDWDIQTVRRRVDISNVLQTIDTNTLVGCVSFCSSLNTIVVPSLYYHKEAGQCTCNLDIDENSEDESEPKIVYGTRRKLTQIAITDGPYGRTTIWPYKQDCFDLLEDLYTEDGIYVIYPPGGSVTDTWCDMTNGGWTVIQRRMDGSENFYRGWNDYTAGFGNRSGEYWLGLEIMHHLTKNGGELSVQMEAFPGVTPSSMKAHYSYFSIGDSVSKYTLHISGFNGTCGNSFSKENGKPFSTFDQDNDKFGTRNCASHYKGAWWYDRCHESHLNGLYYQEGEYKFIQPLLATGIHWVHCWGRQQSAKYAIMKIKRLP